MAKEENKTIVRQLVAEVYNTGNIELAEKYFDAACVLHHPALPQLGQGIEAVKGFIAGVLSAFPDFHVTIEDLIAEDDKVVNRATISGTFEGAFGAIPPTASTPRGRRRLSAASPAAKLSRYGRMWICWVGSSVWASSRHWGR